MFKPVATGMSFPQLEQEVLAWWDEQQIVAQSLASGTKPFVFYEGPPTANGRPGLHHVISRAFKDIILRYRAMQGYKIIGRREGWDTHGLPVEIEVEKKLGFSGKPDIERYGIAAFNKLCRESVWEYIQEWKTFTQRIAYWVDEDGYYTYDNKYIESLWWIFSQLWQRQLLFRDYKVTMHCPRCGTSLSDHEVSLGARDDVDDPSVFIKFRLSGACFQGGDAALAASLAGTFMVAWTTTPWTLPANIALAVQHGATYAEVEHAGERLILAESLVERVLGSEVTVLRTFTGNDLVGLQYERLFNGVPGASDTPDLDAAYRVIADEIVTLDDGTGVVHIAPAYGDLEVGRKHGLPTVFSVDLNGMVMAELGEFPFTGKFFKEADPAITRNLKERGLLLKSGRVRHYYPFCWRCNTPLLFYAKPSWYIRTTAFKPDLVANNQQIHWVPEHIRDGRFGNWLANNIDWAVSRERYWGTPLPIWSNADGSHMECIGSVAELAAKAGRALDDLDLHRPYVDEVTWEDPQHGLMRRIPDVADCWFDSGAMPVAQWHYPFENQQLFAAAHPADYICEAVDQTRGWFYTLHAESTLLFDRPAFHNVICLGHILDEHGQKMSKTKGNIVLPSEVIDAFGVDALRWYLFAAAPPGNPRRFSLNLVNESLRKFLLTLWNTYGFLVTYAELDGWRPATRRGEGDAGRRGGEEARGDEATRRGEGDAGIELALQPIDRWALAALNGLVRDVTNDFEQYEVYPAARRIERFVDELSNWYVRRNRRRFWKSETDGDKQAAYHTLYTCLLTLAKLSAPFIPFVSEAIYRNLTGQTSGAVTDGVAQSVHLAAWPRVNAQYLDEGLVADTAALLAAVSLGRAARKGANLKVRQPLGELWLRASSPNALAGVRRFEADLRDELNVKAVQYLAASSAIVDYRFKPNLRLVGKKYGKQVPALTAALKALEGETARDFAQRCEAGEMLELQLADGQTLTLRAEEILVESSAPEGFAVAEGDGMLVALSTVVTPELRLEGAARDLVRSIQDARKSAGLAIADRIALYLTSADEAELLEQTVATWGDYLRNETLATSLSIGPAPAEAHRETVEFGAGQAEVGVSRE
ncbi:MAG: isoleucine--tRNA ligase [Candidatus Viridilinea halotolerans]|uniref:Isoleucine--tRNA ligase n=1 Tax=Candidatus Viridilinea halotolerans TaxID=2491704 RepID=A0A426TT07_9CHLR|nr:MAG: isoleucine--tRNA ligase [Candidatus Viridilinea halotolerans]